MTYEPTPISEDSLRFVHRHPVIAAAVETVGAVAIVIALEALGVLANSPAQERFNIAMAAVIAFPMMASINLHHAAKAKERLTARWRSCGGAA